MLFFPSTLAPKEAAKDRGADGDSIYQDATGVLSLSWVGVAAQVDLSSTMVLGVVGKLPV